MPKPSFDVSREEAHAIREIVERAAQMYHANFPDEPRLDVLTLAMDLTACHANGCPLELVRLMAADDFSFAHDVFGISGHMNRKTGRLGGLFVPRFWRKPSTPEPVLPEAWNDRVVEEAATFHPSAWQSLQPVESEPVPLGYEAASFPANYY